MTQQEIATRLTRYHFVGLWPYTKLAKEAGLSQDTIRRAMSGSMSDKTQTRLKMLFKQLPETLQVRPRKGKPGHKKRFLIRYLNLRSWISSIEEVAGKNPKFNLKKRYDLSTTEAAGYVCMKLDFMLKWYLLKVFGEELKKKRIYFGDCYQAEHWIDRIAKALPMFKKDLIAKIQHRNGVKNDRH